MVTLYVAGSMGNSLKSLITVREKEIPADVRPVDALSMEQYRLPISHLTGKGCLPVLVDGDVALSESSIINEYLEEQFAGLSLMPNTPAGRWRARMWFKFVNEDLAPTVTLLAWRQWGLPALTSEDAAALLSRTTEIQPQDRRAHWTSALAGFSEVSKDLTDAKLRNFLALTEAQLRVSEYLAGDAYSLADVDTWPFVEPLRRLERDLLAEFPLTAQWIERVLSRPAVAGLYEQYRDASWVPGPELIRWG